MNFMGEFIYRIIKEYHKYCIQHILKNNIPDDFKLFLITKHLVWLKQNDETYKFVDTIDKLKSMFNKND